MDIVCIGAGYVGLVTAAALVHLGHTVVLLEQDREKTEKLKCGEIPFFEPGLEELVHKELGVKLIITSDYHDISAAEVIFIAVGTPQGADGSADLKYVQAAAESMAAYLPQDRLTVIVNKSTVPVGTGKRVFSWISVKNPSLKENISVVSNPEFLREGNAIADFLKPDRIVIGTDDKRAREQMRDLYLPLLEQSPKSSYLETDLISAELIKYAANAFLAVKISYANELARLSQAVGANIEDVTKGIGLDSRIGSKFLEVSCGWGGSCFPKDVSELVVMAKSYQTELQVVQGAMRANDEMPKYCIAKLQTALKNLAGLRIGVLGLTFKPETDDVRMTPAQPVLTQLVKLGAVVRVHDPLGMPMFRKLYAELAVEYCDTPEEVFFDADGVVLLTHWSLYKDLAWNKLQKQMRNPYVLDTRNFLTSETLKTGGFTYEGLGK
ncbi:MAG: hypothetical protein RLZ12_546 [Bacillota bacterium]|jgi:UDPglucose 6-dehydrogenase